MTDHLWAMENNLWGLANIVTGFAVLQMLAFLHRLPTDLAMLYDLPKWRRGILAAIMVIAGGVYSFMVCRIGDLAVALEPQGSKISSTWNEVTDGRIGAIALFILLGIFGLFAREILAPRRSEAPAKQP